MSNQALAKSKRSRLQRAIEGKLGVLITHGHILDGAGPARFGWGALYPSKTSFVGYTLRDAANKLIAKDVDSLQHHANEGTLLALGWTKADVDNAVADGRIVYKRDGGLESV